MGVADDLLYEYALIRYVPRIDREEFVNIGLIMMNKRKKWIKALVMFDDSRINALYPGTDLDCLKNQARLFEMNHVPAKDIPVEEKYRWLTAVKSACLQVSPSHPGLLPSLKHDEDISSKMSKEFSRLFSQLVL